MQARADLRRAGQLACTGFFAVTLDEHKNDYGAHAEAQDLAQARREDSVRHCGLARGVRTARLVIGLLNEMIPGIVGSESGGDLNRR